MQLLFELSSVLFVCWLVGNSNRTRLALHDTHYCTLSWMDDGKWRSDPMRQQNRWTGGDNRKHCCLP